MPTHTTQLPRALFALGVIPAVLFVAACSTSTAANRTSNLLPPSIDAYPELTPTAVHDIQVFRRGTTLTLTNTTATNFPAGILWINQRFGHPTPFFPPGETLQLDLTDFVDQYDSTFRAGGFFATQDPDPIVIAELETMPSTDDAQLHGLIVVENILN